VPVYVLPLFEFISSTAVLFTCNVSLTVSMGCRLSRCCVFCFVSYFNDVEMASLLFGDSSRATHNHTHTLSHGQHPHSMHTHYEQSQA